MTAVPAFDPSAFFRLAGVSGGQAGFGGTAAGDVLDLQGADAAPDTGIIRLNSPVTQTYDTVSNTTPAQAFANTWNPTASVTGVYIGGYLSVAYDFTVSTGVYIPATFSDTATSRIAATPGFSAYTFINQLHTIRNSGNFDLPAGLVMNIGLTHERNTAGTSTTGGTTGVSFSPQTRSTVSGAVMTKTDQTAVRCSPTFSTVAGSTVNLGTIRGLHCFNVAVALFQTQGGLENMTAYRGVDVNAVPFGGNVEKVAVRSLLTAASNTHFLNNIGGAQSDFGGGPILDASLVQVMNDVFGLSLGAAGGDIQILWNGSALEFDPIIGDDMRISFAADIHTVVSASTSEDSAINFNYPKGAFGEGGAPGNNKYRFVANAETVTIGGEFSQFLLTQAANDTIDVGLSLYAGWTINTPTPTIGTGSITTVAGLNVGGNANVGTNRVGLRVISNPSGGAGVNAALWVTAGDTELDGDLSHNGTNLGFYGAAPVAQAAAYTPTNVTPDRAYDANATTTAELADVLGTLIADLQAVGLVA